MSEVLRSYTPPQGRIKPPRGRQRVSLGCGKWFLALILIAGGAVWWLTRDSYPLEGLIPAGQRYEVVANDILAKRGKVASSRLWQALPESMGAADMASRLADVGVPEYILNNLVPHTCYVCGNDLESFSDVLFATKATHLGALLARAHRFFPGTTIDKAGGLKMRHVADMGVYYAVRGRVVVMSRSRRALIQALTLQPEESLAGQPEAEDWKEAGAEDLRGKVTLGQDDPLGDVLSSVRFAVRVQPDGAVLKCRAVVRPEWEQRLAGVLTGLTPKTLDAPPAGVAGLAIDLGQPLPDLWRNVAESAQLEEQAAAIQVEVTSMLEEKCPGLKEFAIALLDATGPGMGLSWHGIDLNAMLPMPELVLTFDADRAAVSEVFAGLEAPEGARPWDCYPQYDADANMVHAVTVGGPSMHPAAALLGGQLLVSSSRAVAQTFVAGARKPEPLPDEGNVFVRVDPQGCYDAVKGLFELFVQYDLLRDTTPQDLETRLAPWAKSVAILDELTALAGYDGGQVAVDINVACTPAS